MSNIQETYDYWNAESFIVDQIEKTEDMNERLVKLYDYYRVIELELEDTDLV